MSARSSSKIIEVPEDGAEEANANLQPITNEENKIEIDPLFTSSAKRGLLRKRMFRWSCIKCWSNVPHCIWSAFVEACYIPAYRWEWGNYSKWTYEKYGKRRMKSENTNVNILQMRRKKKRENRAQLSLPGNHGHQGCQRVVINCSGVRFETQLRTLREFPNTLLGNPRRRLRYWNPKTCEYFFDRPPECFESIIHFYQTRGTSLARPSLFKLNDFIKELNFFGIKDRRVHEFMQEEAGFNENFNQSLPSDLFKRKLWLLTEYPNSSRQARCFSLLSIAAVIVSTVSYCVGTMDVFRVGFQKHEEIIDFKDPLFFTETICAIFFVFELTLRFYACPDRLIFLEGFCNIIDSASTLSYVLEIILFYSSNANRVAEVEEHPNLHYVSFDPNSILERFHRIVKLIRVFRILKLSRYSLGLRILGQTFRTSLRELGLLAFFLMVGVILFSSALFFVEGYFNPMTSFDSIPDTFFWAVSTMTTTGFDTNDKLPKTVAGKLIGSLCAVAGVLTLSLPVPVVVANFSYYYNQSKAKKAMKQKRRYIRACPYLPTCEQNHGEFQSDARSATSLN